MTSHDKIKLSVGKDNHWERNNLQKRRCKEKWKGCEMMLTAVSGYYNGEHIVTEEKVDLVAGQKVIITILEYTPEKKKKVDLSSYMGRGAKLFDSDANDYVRGLRSDDRV